MNISADYFESLELHPGEPVSSGTDPETPSAAHAAAGEQGASDATPATEQAEIAAGLDAILHSDSLDHVVAEVGAACLTRSAVASAVHTAVTDAVQAAVSGVVAVAVAAAVKANSSMNAEEVEKRFRQKYLGLGTPASPVAETSFLKPPRLQVEEDGSVALSVDAGPLVELTDFDPAFAEAASEENESTEAAFLEALSQDAMRQEAMPQDAMPQDAMRQEIVPQLPAVADEDVVDAPVEQTEPETVLAESPEPELMEAEPVETESIEIEPMETKPVEIEPMEAEPVETESVETESVKESIYAPTPVAPSVQPEPTATPVVLAPEAAAPLVPPAPPVPTTPQDKPSVEVVEKTKNAELATMPELTRPAMPEHAQEPESIERTLRDEKSIQFVGFQVGTQMYAVPSILIREVIRRQPVSRLPVHSRYAPGVINLRGLVIPLVSLRELLQADMPQEGARNQFCIITGTEGLRIALEVDKIRSMYVVQQADIVWNVASVLGLDDDTVIGLFELEERLVPILSVERVAAILLEEGIDVESLTS